jgi:hypothetical protein
MRQLKAQATSPTMPQQFPMLDASDLPGDEDWAVLESLGLDHGVTDDEYEDDLLDEVKVARGAFD